MPTFAVQCADRDTGDTFRIKLEAPDAKRAMAQAERAGHMVGSVTRLGADGQSPPDSPPAPPTSRNEAQSGVAADTLSRIEVYLRSREFSRKIMWAVGWGIIASMLISTLIGLLIVFAIGSLGLTLH